jgi:prepilin-type N-terminal cleavage/methylation domain-containing protein
MRSSHQNFSRKGFSLVEMIIYIALIAIIFVFVINLVLSFASSYKDIAALRIVDRSAMNSLERMTRDIRNATSIDMVLSGFNVNPGTLALIETTAGVSTTTRFYIQSGTLKVDVNGVFSGPLTGNRATVTNLVFHLLTSTSSQAVKIDMTVQGTSGTVSKTKSYYSTIILKGS